MCIGTMLHAILIGFYVAVSDYCIMESIRDTYISLIDSNESLIIDDDALEKVSCKLEVLFFTSL